MEKRFRFLVILSIVIFQLNAQPLTILESNGWLESTYLTWQVNDTADSYNVYYSGEGITDQKIDDQLIRNYGDYFRADVLGLKAGTYTFKVVPVNDETEGDAVESNPVDVEAHDRSGFAFSNNRVPGAYKLDGTPKDNAVVLYITENTKNTISLEVTGANSNPCVGLQEILDGFKKGDDNRPLIVRLIGQVTDLEYMNKGDVVIENENNSSGSITFEGVGNDAVADGWGIRVKNASNIEIRNIGMMNCNSDEGDNISLQQNNEYIWVHHVDFFYGNPGGDADQAKGDGALDSKTSGYVTISYNHFWDSGKSNLLGNGVEEPEYLTYHHNWYDHSDSRHPRVRNHSVHVYNNYYDGNSKYGVGSTMASSVFVEANYFRNCKYPILTSMQGSDVYDSETGLNDYSDMPTFSKEDGGSIKAFNNYMTGHTRFVAYGDTDYPNPTVDFDAYVASTRNEMMGSSVVSAYGANTYNNFDTDPSVMYDYTADSPEDAKTKVESWSGRMYGGDFNWDFNDAVDDISYTVNAGLKSALTGYTTNLVWIQGDSTGTGQPVDTSSTDTTTISPDALIHNFTTDGLNSSFYTISGNLSDSKGTVSFNSLTLIQCLKIESSTTISFNLEKEAELTLVFNHEFNGEIKVDGISHLVSSGILSLDLTSGAHQITKDDICNLYYMSVEYDNTDVTAIEISRIDKPQLYPNPVRDILSIEMDQPMKEVSIYNLSGILVKHIEGQLESVDLTDFSRGGYIVVIRTDNEVFKQFIIKE